MTKITLKEAIFKMKPGDRFKYPRNNEFSFMYKSKRGDIRFENDDGYVPMTGPNFDQEGEIIPAEPKVMSAEAAWDEYDSDYKHLSGAESFFMHGFSVGDKNGARRMWLEFKKELIDMQINKDYFAVSLQDAVEKLKPE